MSELLIGSGAEAFGSDYEAHAARLLDGFFHGSDATPIRAEFVDSNVLRALFTVPRLCSVESDQPVGIRFGDGEPALYWLLRHEPVSDIDPGALLANEGLDEDGRPVPDTEPVALVRWVVNVLGSSESAVIKCAEAERAYRYYKSRRTTQLRSESRNKLWSLARAVRVMHDYLGADLKSWFLSSPEHAKLLRERQWDQLRELAVEEAARSGRMRDPQGLDEAHERSRQVGYGGGAGLADTDTGLRHNH